MTCERKSKRRGSYSKFSPEQQAAIGKYASLNGNQAAIQHFSKQLGVELKVTSVQTWKTKYLAELNRKRKAGETDDLTVKALPVKKLGRDQRTHVCCIIDNIVLYYLWLYAHARVQASACIRN